MGGKKKIPQEGGATKPAQNFDDFLETLDASDSESDDSDVEDNDSEGSDEDQEVDDEPNEDAASSDEEEEEEAQNGELSNDEGEDADTDAINDELEFTEEPNRNKTFNGAVDSESSDDDQDPEQTAEEHKKVLQRLRDSDPDFFEYLKENDAELLNFDDSNESDSEDEDGEEPLHKPPEELEEASDSEAEEERVDTTSKDYKGKVENFIAKGIVNLDVISDWETKLSSTRDLGVLVNVIEAFECAVHQILQDGNVEDQKWKVDGSAHFNALVRLCIKHVKGFCVRYLCSSNNLTVSEQKFDQRPLEFKDKCSQRWSKLRSKLKAYMNTLVAFLKSMGNSDAVASILRHCQKMSGFWALLASKSFKLLRTLINIWSQGEDSCKVLAFLTIVRMTNYNREVFLLRVYKQMYLSYVANSKFTSVNTWPGLNFMRSSLTEVFLLDTSLTYATAFPFIRQLAIHLRNALTAGTSVQNQTRQNKKEASRIVYSWQFVHSLHLWADLLSHCSSTNDDNLKLLVYPVVQICLGTIKLIPTKKYIPLRFLIVRMLIKLQEKGGVFIPILPLITEVLLMTDFSSKSISKFSVRPLDMTCCLKADASESGYAKSISENVFELVLRSCKAIATELSFPEIVTPTLMQLRSFLKKKCKNPEVSRKYKTLIEKIDANSNYISLKRNKALDSGSVSISDVESQKILRVQMETTKPHPPILEFAKEYLKVNAKTQAKMRKVNLETREEKLIPKPTVATTSKNQKTAMDGQIFGSDDDDDMDTDFKTKLDPEVELAVTQKLKKKSKLKRKQENLKSDKIPKTKGKKQKQMEPEAQDELVDLELSD